MRRAGLRAASQHVARATATRHQTGGTHTETERQHRHALLDHQATLRRGLPPGPRADPTTYRDYPRLVALAGLARQEYLALPPMEQRQARLTIDRALDTRMQAQHELVAARALPPAPRDRAPVDDRVVDLLDLDPARRAAAARRPRQSARERQFAALRGEERPDRRRP